MGRLASEWVKGLRKDYTDLSIEKQRLLEQDNSRPVLQEALIAKTDRLIMAAAQKITIANHISKIVEELDHGKVTVITSEIELEFEW